ncbi:tannase/feruloyl esterase family alpha/beta hydrolase [Actinomadura sp. 7K507]|uniref:tannase/feruloyl esterase family alpha/beta hydrolase n=1 Tax=Actinomadura sp. 7K507 TaxID=2530365 RepID=UPI00104BE6D8|nr:tannase/feruloyl esterase family alpha/beta hydrolase [Actinomadura sp. 7K507]TDC79368.1 tannase/feruloyl esterase family alpha/beta hydrolase [Actinomadura sp. 7K507]
MAILGRSSVFSAAAVTFLAATLVTAVPAAQADTRCLRMDRVHVPGAQRLVTACLDDLTTAGTVASGHTDPAQWTGLHAAATRNPSGIPGIQIDGYFRDGSTLNTTHGWNHDSQFVIRLPEDWNGGLVVSGAPGTRRQYANDFTISDWVLAKGYAFASTDKGNNGNEFYTDGRRPGDAIREWYHRMTQLTVAAKATVARHYRRAPRRTYAAGISNGGQLVRWALENHPELYDGGIDSEGTYWPRDDGPNALTYLPAALRNYPEYKATGDRRAHAAMLRAGFARGSEFLWDFNYTNIWDNTQRIYREEVDPSYDGDLEAGIPYCESGTPGCDTDYRYRSRPRSVHRTVKALGHSGRIGKPMITVHGTLDTLLPIKVHSDAYAGKIRERGRGGLHRYYRIEGASHLDLEYDLFPDRMRPLLPCMRTAFEALERWTAPRGGDAPPPSATVPRQTSGDVANSCSIG